MQLLPEVAAEQYSASSLGPQLVPATVQPPTCSGFIFLQSCALLGCLCAVLQMPF